MGVLGDRALYRSILDFIGFQKFRRSERCGVLADVSCGLRESRAAPRASGRSGSAVGRSSITRCSLVSRLVAPTAAGRRADPVPVPRHGRQRERGIRPEPVAERRCGRDRKAVGETIRAQAIDATRKSRGRLHASWIFFSVHKLVASDRLVTALIEFRSSTGCPQDRAGCPQTITARQQPRRVVPRVFHRYGHGFVDGFWRPCDRAGDEAPGNQGLSLCKGKAERESTIARGSRHLHDEGFQEFRERAMPTPALGVADDSRQPVSSWPSISAGSRGPDHARKLATPGQTRKKLTKAASGTEGSKPGAGTFHGPERMGPSADHPSAFHRRASRPPAPPFAPRDPQATFRRGGRGRGRR